MAETLKFDAADEHDTLALGKVFAQALAAALPKSPAVVALIGPLGAGKTRFVQAVASAAGVEEGVVASPTFVLVHEYAGIVPIYHFDAYRLASEAEFAALGTDEYFSLPGWSFIEWGDRISNCLPADRLEVTIEPDEASARRFTIRALGAQHQVVLEELNRRLREPR